MKCLITGATGFIGSHLSPELEKKCLLVHQGKREIPNEILSRYYVQKDINGDSDWVEHLDGVDVVIHLAGLAHSSSFTYKQYSTVNVDGVLKLAHDSVKSNVKRFVFVSSINVNGSNTIDRPFSWKDKAVPSNEAAQSKFNAELGLREIAKQTGLEVVIIRPTLVYGPGVKANFASLMNLVSKGIPLPFGCIKDNRRSLVSVKNLVDLIVTCVDHPKAANQTFLVSDDHDISTSEMVAQMAKSLGKSQWQLPVPLWCYRLTGKLFNKQDVVDRLVGSLQVDITHTKETLGWNPPQSLEDGFNETAEAFLKNNKVVK